MVEEIYGDVLFIINFSMDFLSLYMVGKLLHIPMRAWRVMLGASVGAAYGVVELLLTLDRFFSFLLTAGVMLFMCLVAYGVQKKRRYLLTMALFCGVNMLMGGMMTAAFVKLGAYEQYIEIGGDIHTVFGDMPIWFFAILAALSALATWGLGRVFRRERGVRTVKLRVSLGGNETEMTALLDSGNLLSEPLSGTPVILVKEKDAVFFPPVLLSAMRQGMASMDVNAMMRLRYVPMKTAAGAGLLTAAVPEALFLELGGKWEARQALLAVDFTEGDYGGLPALVPEILI